MEDIKGKELDLCPKNKKRCIFNQSHWKNSNGLSRKCIGCLETSPPPLIKYKEIMTKAELKEEYQKGFIAGAKLTGEQAEEIHAIELAELKKPMGVSQWKQYGIKYGYDKYFKINWDKQNRTPDEQIGYYITIHIALVIIGILLFIGLVAWCFIHLI